MTQLIPSQTGESMGLSVLFEVSFIVDHVGHSQQYQHWRVLIISKLVSFSICQSNNLWIVLMEILATLDVMEDFNHLHSCTLTRNLSCQRKTIHIKHQTVDVNIKKAMGGYLQVGLTMFLLIALYSYNVLYFLVLFQSQLTLVLQCSNFTRVE